MLLTFNNEKQTNDYFDLTHNMNKLHVKMQNITPSMRLHVTMKGALITIKICKWEILPTTFHFDSMELKVLGIQTPYDDGVKNIEMIS